MERYDGMLDPVQTAGYIYRPPRRQKGQMGGASAYSRLLLQGGEISLTIGEGLRHLVSRTGTLYSIRFLRQCTAICEL